MGRSSNLRRYELMLVLRPDTPDEQVQALLDRATRQIAAAGGPTVKVSPWGRRRLAYPIGQHPEGSHFPFPFSAPAHGGPRVQANPKFSGEEVGYPLAGPDP